MSTLTKTKHLGTDPKLRRYDDIRELIVGSSTGAIVHAVTEFSKDHEGLAVAVSPDSGFKYATFFADALGDEGRPKV